MIRVDGNLVMVDTRTQKAVFSEGRLVELISKLDGVRYLYDTAEDRDFPLRFVYPFNRVYSLGRKSEVRVETLPYSDYLVNVSFFGWHGHGDILIEEDAASGDIFVTPSLQTSMSGLKACRWEMFGIDRNVEVAVPYMQGFRAPISDPIFMTENLQDLRYPFRWESSFVGFGNSKGGFWVRSDCMTKKYKTLHIGKADDPYCAIFDSENAGPLDGELSAGGTTWKINVYSGDWTVPVYLYRETMMKHPIWIKAEKSLPPWFGDVTLGYSWCVTDRNVLTTLKKYIDPKKVILHLYNWRPMVYDQEYPHYVSSAEAKAFIREGTEMGFHIAPHCNSLEIDPTLPEYELVRDFKYRDLETRQVWGWGISKGGYVGVPEDNLASRNNRKYNVMAKIHPALPSWQNLLAANVKKAVDENGLHTVFLDVTHNLYNIHNGVVNGDNSMGGMEDLLDIIKKINGGIALGGEGMNEMILGQCFAQGHSANIEKENRPIPWEFYKPVNSILYGDLCHVMGYGGEGSEERQLLQNIRDENRGFIPTLYSVDDSLLKTPGSSQYNTIERALSL